MRFLILCALLWPVSVAAQEIGEFRAIEVQEDVRLNVTIAPDYDVSSVAIEGDVSKLRMRQFLPWIVFDRETRWLIFPQWRDDVIEVSVETPVLNGLKAFDGALATFTGDADERLWVEAGNNGRVNIDVTVDELTLFAREGGEIFASGTCDQLTIRNEGLSVDATGLTCMSVVINGDVANVLLSDGVAIVDAHPGEES